MNGEDRPLAGRISVWMQNELRKADAKGVVIGLSGGVDSAVVAALCKMAAGDNALGLIMPCHSVPQSATDAVLVARKTGLKTVVIDLTATYDALVPKLPHVEGIELTNIRPRLRMTALYCAAQAYRYLVVGTGNKSERMIGYFTKWGDGGCDILPIADLYKHEVYSLARELDIPEEVINKPPTADLWHGQTDENEIGMGYDELDKILAGIETGDISECDPAKVERVRELIDKSEHKREPVPYFSVK